MANIANNPLDNKLWLDQWTVSITPPNTAITYIPPIQFPPPPQMPAPTYQYDYTPDITDRIAELELKVSQLLVILDYITGVKDGTKPKDVQSEEKTAKTDT